MAVLPVLPPRIVGIPGLDSPNIGSYNLSQAAAIREGDFVGLSLAATILVPNPTGALATAAGPSPAIDFNLNTTGATATSGPVTVTAVTSAGAPAQTYYVVLTYTATGTESLAGSEFLINTAPGLLPQINVSATGAPAGTTNYAVYAGIYSSGEALQQATRTTTATGANFSLTYPLAFNRGANRIVPGATVGTAAYPIVGLAMADSQAIYVNGPGGAFTANIGTPLGAWMPPSPLGPGDPLQLLVAKVNNGQVIEMSLRQAWAPSLIGSTVGLYIDPTSGYFEADSTAASLPFTIIDKTLGTSIEGVFGDTNARVKVVANTATGVI